MREVAKDDLYRSYTEFATKSQTRAVLNQQMFWVEFRSFLPNVIDTVVKKDGASDIIHKLNVGKVEKKYHYVILPPLDEAIARFEMTSNIKIKNDNVTKSAIVVPETNMFGALSFEMAPVLVESSIESEYDFDWLRIHMLFNLGLSNGTSKLTVNLQRSYINSAASLSSSTSVTCSSASCVYSR